MLKVAHIVRRFVFEEWGGTETVVWNTALHQLQQGLQPEILATAALGQPGTETRDGIVIRRFPYHYPYLPLPPHDRLALDKKGGNPYAPQLWRHLAENHYDICHCHCAGRLATFSAAIAHHHRIPCLISIHGGAADVPKQELELMLKPVRHKFHYGGLIDRILRLSGDPIARMDAVICISHTEQQRLQQRFPNKTIRYLPNGISAKRFRQPDSISLRQTLHIPADRRLIVCISRIDYQKNQRALVRLLQQTADTHLLLIGPITAPWYADAIRADVDDAHLQQRFTLVPGLPHDDPLLPAALHDADTFILPSLHEPFGIVALEAWAAGTPVIAANVGGLRDIIRDGHNGLLFDPTQPDSLLNAWNRLHRNDDHGRQLRQRLVAQATQDVAAYEWPALVRQLTQLYHDLRSHHATP